VVSGVLKSSGGYRLAGCPHGAVDGHPNTSDSAIADGDYAQQIRRLLHLYNGQRMDDAGNYPGKFRPLISDLGLIRHLGGQEAWAFSVVTRTQADGRSLARFVGLDVDQRAQERLPIIRQAVNELKMANAVFCTPGSTLAKCKVIVTLREMMPRGLVRSLAMVLYGHCRAIAPDLFPERETNGDIEIYPKDPRVGTDGGLLRVLGRHIVRSGPLETPMHFDGSWLDVFKLQPLNRHRVEKLARPRMTSPDSRPQWVSEWLSASWSGLSRPAVGKRLFGLACYCVKRNSVHLYEPMLRDLEAKNSALRSSRSDPRNPIAREIADGYFLKKATSQVPALKPRPLSSDAPGRTAHDAIVQYVRVHACNPHHFPAPAHIIAGIAGVNKSAAQRQINLLERDRKIVRFEYGKPRSVREGKVQQGVSATFGLVLEGETVYDVIGDVYKRRPGTREDHCPAVHHRGRCHAESVQRPCRSGRTATTCRVKRPIRAPASQ